jgi:hypothetical protein
MRWYSDSLTHHLVAATVGRKSLLQLLLSRMALGREVSWMVLLFLPIHLDGKCNLK